MMVGDGANDCQALKAADVGLALNTQEASLAADFTSTDTVDISVVPELLRQGKACLSTSLGSFKYMSYYSFIQFSTMCILYQYNRVIADIHYYFIDIGLLFLLIPTMNCSLPNRLVWQTPNPHLVRFEVLLEIIGNHLLHLGG